MSSVVYFHPALPEVVQSRIHIERVPENNHIDHQSQGAQLVFLPFPVLLTHFAPPPMEHFPRQVWRFSWRLSWVRIRRR